MVSAFLHLSEIDVQVGDVVRQGDLIGKIGESGRATGPHLDWRVNVGAARVDAQLLVPPMEEAQKTLAAKYEVSTKSQDQKKLDPKLTIFDIDTDVVDKEQLLEELLHKNQGINALNTNNRIKVVFTNKKYWYIF